MDGELCTNCPCTSNASIDLISHQVLYHKTQLAFKFTSKIKLCSNRVLFLFVFQKNWKKTLDEFGFFFFPPKKFSKITQFKLGRNKKSSWNSSRPMHALVKVDGTKVQKMGGTPHDLLLLVRAPISQGMYSQNDVISHLIPSMLKQIIIIIIIIIIIN